MIVAISRVGGDENILCYSDFKLKFFHKMCKRQVDKTGSSDWYCIP